jgi:hypothetical protein
MFAALVIIAMAVPAFSTAAPLRAQGQGASLSGTASSNAGQTLANYTVQLRNLATGQLAGTTTSGATGGFSFAGLQAGNYAVEVVNAAGQIIGTSASVAVAAGATITGVTVAASAAAGAGAAAAGAATAGAGATGGVSAAVIITGVAVAAGVTGVIVAVNKSNSSPSR